MCLYVSICMCVCVSECVCVFVCVNVWVFMVIDWCHPTDSDVPHKQGLISRSPFILKCIRNMDKYVMDRYKWDYYSLTVTTYQTNHYGHHEYNYVWAVIKTYVVHIHTQTIEICTISPFLERHLTAFRVGLTNNLRTCIIIVYIYWWLLNHFRIATAV